MMQLIRLEVARLFNSFNHCIDFPVPSEGSKSPSLVVLHGENGVGKTTILRLMHGMLNLDFNICRSIPFERAALTFDNGSSLTVQPKEEAPKRWLDVSYDGVSARLHPTESGPLEDKDKPNVESFRNRFFAETEKISFEYIATDRLPSYPEDEEIARYRSMLIDSGMDEYMVRAMRRNPKAREIERPRSLADRVKRFIRDAQVNYRNFFASTEPDLFPKIIDRLTNENYYEYTPTELKERLRKVKEQDSKTERFGLESDRWDFDQMTTQLGLLEQKTGEKRNNAITVISSYVELLESRAAERWLVAERLFTFERVIGSFYVNKRVEIDPRAGIKILTNTDQTITERQLSSGEYHLLFLMVAALVTKRSGTIIGIDEPEMSLHISWQRKLIRALLECSSNANPLFILATHSPDLAAAYPDAMVELGTRH